VTLSSYPPAAASKARVQLSAIRSREAFVESRHGAAGVQRLRSEASSALREVLSGPPPDGGWVGFERFLEVNVLVDRLFGRGDLALVWDTGRFAASHAIGVWKSLFLKTLNPNTVVSVAAGLWRHHYDGGRLVMRPYGSTGLSLAILDFPTPHRVHCKAIGGWVQGTLELGPRTGIVVQELSCRASGAQNCEFRIAWQ
jgi:hypothetical protein